MSKITKTLFGGSDSRQSSGPSFGVRRTPYSSFSGDTLNLDPSIRGLQEETLSGVRGVASGAGDVISNLRSIRERLSGNTNPFIQARVNPLERALAARRGELQQSIGQRGLSGSSFGEQAMTGFETDAGRALGDARAMATQEALGAEAGIDQQTMNALIGQAQLYGIPADVAKQRIMQELESFGFGKAQVSEGRADQRNGIFPSLFPKGVSF